LIVGGLGLGHRQFRLDPSRPGRFLDAFCALHDQRRLQRGNVLGRSSGVVVTGPIISHRRG
jgi:hypothetical protein